MDHSGYVNVEAALHPRNNYMAHIGTSTKKFRAMYTYELYVNGVSVTSDEKVKKNIKTITPTLSKLMLLNPVSYEMNEAAFTDSPKDFADYLKKDGTKLGFLAQELQKVYPEMVKFDEVTKLYSVEYIELIPVLTKAIQEQQTLIEEQQKQIDKLESCCTNNFFKSDSKATNIGQNQSVEGATLYQNEPNPFTGLTIIRFVLPETVKSAFIGIYNLNGTQVKSITINERGESSITINGSELKAGMYFYSLIADGKEVDTKRMILTE